LEGRVNFIDLHIDSEDIDMIFDITIHVTGIKRENRLNPDKPELTIEN